MEALVKLFSLALAVILLLAAHAAAVPLGTKNDESEAEPEIAVNEIVGIEKVFGDPGFRDMMLERLGGDIANLDPRDGMARMLQLDALVNELNEHIKFDHMMQAQGEDQEVKPIDIEASAHSDNLKPLIRVHRNRREADGDKEADPDRAKREVHEEEGPLCVGPDCFEGEIIAEEVAPSCVGPDCVEGERVKREIDEDPLCVGPECLDGDVEEEAEEDPLCFGPECVDSADRFKRDVNEEPLCVGPECLNEEEGPLCVGPECFNQEEEPLCVGPECADEGDSPRLKREVGPQCIGPDCLEENDEELVAEAEEEPLCVGPECVEEEEEEEEQSVRVKRAVQPPSCVGPACAQPPSCVGPACEEEGGAALERVRRDAPPCFGPGCKEEGDEDRDARADRVVDTNDAKEDAAEEGGGKPSCFGPECAEKQEEEGGARAGGRGNSRELHLAENIKVEDDKPECFGPDCAAKADEVRGGDAFGFAFDPRRDGDRVEEDRRQSGPHTPPPPRPHGGNIIERDSFKIPGPEYKQHREGDVNPPLDMSDIQALERDAENLLKAIEARYNAEINKLRIIDQKLRDLNLETESKVEDELPDLPNEMQLTAEKVRSGAKALRKKALDESKAHKEREAFVDGKLDELDEEKKERDRKEEVEEVKKKIEEKEREKEKKAEELKKELEEKERNTATTTATTEKTTISSTVAGASTTSLGPSSTKEDKKELPDKTDDKAVKLNKEQLKAVNFPRDAQGMAANALPKGVQDVLPKLSKSQMQGQPSMSGTPQEDGDNKKEEEEEKEKPQ